MEDRIQSQIDFYDTIATTFAREHAEVGSLGNTVLAKVPRVPSIFEIASGAGRWTEKLCDLAERVVAVDSSSNLLKLSQIRLKGKPVEHIHADIFSWPNLGVFDAVFFAFWLSHVPEDKFEEFWTYVRRSLRPMGQVVFVDSVHSGTGGGGDVRRTPDGRTFEIVKVPHDPEKLVGRLQAMGFAAAVWALSDNIYMGTAHVQEPS